MPAPFRSLWTVAFAAKSSKFTATRPVGFLSKISQPKELIN
jgi:hypothetical protein